MTSRRPQIHGSRAERRVRLQFWRQDPKELDPHLFVDPGWDPNERQQVLAYLNACYDAGFTPPSSLIWCPFGCKNFDAWGRDMLTDGTWWFPEILIHYLRDHAVKPPVEFLSHMQRLSYTVPVFPAD